MDLYLSLERQKTTKLTRKLREKLVSFSQGEGKQSR